MAAGTGQEDADGETKEARQTHIHPYPLLLSWHDLPDTPAPYRALLHMCHSAVCVWLYSSVFSVSLCVRECGCAYVYVSVSVWLGEGCGFSGQF